MKTCDEPGCTYFVWGGKKCKGHQGSRTDKKPKKPKKPPKPKVYKPKVYKPKVYKPIRKVAPKRAKERSIYSRRKPIWMARPENEMCRVFPWLKAVDIHHSWGTENGRLLMEEFWIAVSRKGHNWIDDHPEEAYELGLMLYRNVNYETVE